MSLHGRSGVWFIAHEAPVVPFAIDAIGDMDADEGIAFGRCGELVEKTDGVGFGELEPDFGGHGGTGGAPEVILNVACGELAVGCFEVAVVVAGEFLGVFFFPPVGGIEMPAEHDGGVGTGVEHAADLFAGEGDVERAFFGKTVGHEEVQLVELEADGGELPDGLLGLLVEAEAATGAVGQGVEAGDGGLAIEEERGLAVVGFDLGRQGFCRRDGEGSGGLKEEAAVHGLLVLGGLLEPVDDEPEAAPDEGITDQKERNPDPLAGEGGIGECCGGEQGYGWIGDGEEDHRIGIEGSFWSVFGAFDQKNLPGAQTEIEHETANEKLRGCE